MGFYINAIICIILFCLYDYIKDRRIEKYNQELRKEYFRSQDDLEE